MTGSPTIELAYNVNGIFFADDSGNTAFSDLSNALPVISVQPKSSIATRPSARNR